MEFLEICQRLRQEVGANGTGPAAVTGQTGESKRFVDWVNSAWLDVQRKHLNWRFMIGTFSITTSSGDGNYTAADSSPAITDLREWNRDSFNIYLQSQGVSGQVPLAYMDFQTWYDTYNTGGQSNGFPGWFTIAHDLSINIGPKPNGIYVVSGEYWMKATPMAADADLPGSLPDEFHEVILYRAMMKYGRYSAAPEVFDDGKANYKRLIGEMERTQLPEMLLGGPLA